MSNKNVRRFLQPPKNSFFLFGPRGCGKSTWLNEHFKDAHNISLLDEGLYTYNEVDEIFYWSPAEAKHTEVDFLLKKGREYIAIEVKATMKLRPEHYLSIAFAPS